MQLNVNTHPTARETAPAPMQNDEQSSVNLLSGAGDDTQTFWTQAVAFTRERSPASFDQWFSGVQFDGLTDGVLSLRARDEFVRQWVEDYFLPTLSERLQTHTGLSIQVRWTIGGTLDHPVAIRPSSFPPVQPKALSVRPPAPDSTPAIEVGLHR